MTLLKGETGSVQVIDNRYIQISEENIASMVEREGRNPTEAFRLFEFFLTAPSDNFAVNLFAFFGGTAVQTGST